MKIDKLTDCLRPRLVALGQSHLFDMLPGLDEKRREGFLERLAAIDTASLKRMREMLARRLSRGVPVAENAVLEPAPVHVPDEAERAQGAATGVKALSAGRVGVLLVAGGQGSRLGLDGPKGCLPIGPVSGATLYSVHARKVLALERRYGAPIPLYIMTSEANDAATRRCFEDDAWYGLDPSRVVFFVQGMWPALDARGRILLEHPDRPFMSPDGHGGMLAALERHGVFEDMDRRGVTTLFYLQVDNPLVEVADPVFVGLHLGQSAEMSLKVCLKRDPDEGLGMVVRRDDGRLAVIEYSELSHTARHETDADGNLRFRYGSVAIHVFDVGFLKRAAATPMPLHLAHKKVPCCDSRGRIVTPDAPNAFKFEKFIFDILPKARRALILAFERREEFSPVKNAAGDDSPQTCRRDLSAKFARRLEAAGREVPRDKDGFPRHAIEIDPCFAPDPADLAKLIPANLDTGRDILLTPLGDNG